MKRFLVKMCLTALAFWGLSMTAQAQAPGYTVVDLGTLGGSSSRANAINKSGQIVGAAATSAPYGAFPNGATMAFLWDPAHGMTNLGTLPGAENGTGLNGAISESRGINNDGTIVGVSATDNRYFQPFLWKPDVLNGQAGSLLNLGTFQLDLDPLTGPGWIGDS